jgi:hypothetical protein
MVFTSAFASASFSASAGFRLRSSILGICKAIFGVIKSLYKGDSFKQKRRHGSQLLVEFCSKKAISSIIKYKIKIFLMEVIQKLLGYRDHIKAFNLFRNTLSRTALDQIYYNFFFTYDWSHMYWSKYS